MVHSLEQGCPDAGNLERVQDVLGDPTIAAIGGPAVSHDIREFLFDFSTPEADGATVGAAEGLVPANSGS